MKHRLVKPLAFATGIALCTGALAAPSSVFNVQEIDSSINACSDFNGFVNAKWIAANPIPADRTRWGSFDALREASLNVQHKIVEDAASHAAKAAPGSIEQKVGYLYASGMDEAAINKAGFDPIKPQLADIGALKNTADIVSYIRASYARGEPVLFRFGGNADFKNSNNEIAYTGQGGLGLPTTDYYSKPDFEKIRTAYVAHIARLLELTGVEEQPPARGAALDRHRAREEHRRQRQRAHRAPPRRRAIEWLFGRGLLDEALQLAVVEPQAITRTADIDLRVRARGDEHVHLAGAVGAAAALAGSLRGPMRR